jgi:hypothetical protein
MLSEAKHQATSSNDGGWVAWAMQRKTLSLHVLGELFEVAGFLTPFRMKIPQMLSVKSA